MCNNTGNAVSGVIGSGGSGKAIYGCLNDGSGYAGYFEGGDVYCGANIDVAGNIRGAARFFTACSTPTPADGEAVIYFDSSDGKIKARKRVGANYYRAEIVSSWTQE